MQEPDNFENFVKIQIVLQFTLRNVKVIIVFYTGKKSPLRWKHLFPHVKAYFPKNGLGVLLRKQSLVVFGFPIIMWS